MLENWGKEDFSKVAELQQTEKPYPVGITSVGVKIFYMHYATFEDANKKWKERMIRVDDDNLCVMFTNWHGDMELAKRFDALPFKSKVLFTPEPLPNIKSSYVIKGWDSSIPLHRRCTWWGKRYIDQFDYVEFINKIKSPTINEV